MNTSAVPALQPLDLPLKTAVARWTHGISPSSVGIAMQDWATHLWASPGKQVELLDSGRRAMLQWALDLSSLAAGDGAPMRRALGADLRFSQPGWQQAPFAVWASGFLRAQQWWAEAVKGVRGVSRHHEEVADFVVRQWLDMVSPSNQVLTNPEVLEATMESGGTNLLRGVANWWHEAMLVATDGPPPGAEDFKPGVRVATTPGKVVWRNRLAELIQYRPSTAQVLREPVLLVPSWIMKYYILDLSPENSLVRWLVSQGHTVFVVSWKNPDGDDRELGMDDYLELGVLEMLQAVQRAQPQRQVHLAGYCLGGTLAAIAAAELARRHETPLASLSLLAAQTDFEEPGELGLFIDESQVAFLEDVMAERGYLDGRQMAGAFALINSKDLVWSKLVREYLLGRSSALDDLHAWNADATRMPARMHGEYLRRLYLHNDLGQGRYQVRGRPVLLEDVRLPMFVVATERDHVSPWRSVYKVHLLTQTEITFVLTTGGHNVGIVNPPRAAQARLKIAYRIGLQHARDDHVDADTWASRAPRREGSWWPAWQHWLAERSGPAQAPLPLGGRGAQRLVPMEEAPGTYVHRMT